MPRTSRRRRFIKMLTRNLQQRKSLVAMSMLSDDSGSSSDDGGSSSSSSDSTTGAIIFAAAYNSSKKKLEFAEKSRYLFRAGYRKSNQDVFINDLNTGSGDERPWLTEDEFKKKYRMSREALDFITDKIKDDKVFKNKRGPKQMNPKHQLMVLLDYLGNIRKSTGGHRTALTASVRIIPADKSVTCRNWYGSTYGITPPLPINARIIRPAPTIPPLT